MVAPPGKTKPETYVVNFNMFHHFGIKIEKGSVQGNL